MSNRRKLRPFRASIITASEHVSSAYPHEACVYHPGCCDRDDFTCPGCGNTAIGAVMFQLNGVEQRRPFCQEHEAAMGVVTEAMAQRPARPTARPPRSDLHELTLRNRPLFLCHH